MLEEKLERHDPRNVWHPGLLDVAFWTRRRMGKDKSGDIFLKSLVLVAGTSQSKHLHVDKLSMAM